MKKLLIGITGRTGNDGIAGCGKDTVAEMISKQTSIPIYGFADPIYDMVKSGSWYRDWETILIIFCSKCY